MKFDVAVAGGEIVTSGGRRRGTVGIQSGRIAAILAPEASFEADRVIDATGLYVLPGLVDEHVHFREPGMTHKEDFLTGSMAAAAGGVTTVVDMPNGTNPPLVSAAAFRAKRELVRGRSYVDYGFVAAAVPESLSEVEELHREGALAFKVFMAETTGRLGQLDDGQLLDLLEKARRLGALVVAHAENDAIIQHRVARLRAEGRASIWDHAASRPPVGEVEAVRRLITFAEYTGARVHIFHVSCADVVEVIREAKRRGVAVTAETCPPYLLLSDDDLDRAGPVARINPPVRGSAHQQGLWAGLLDGTIDALGTDHAPHTPEEKSAASVWDVPAGTSGVEIATPLMLEEVNRGRLSLEHFVRIRSENPARIMGLFPRKGNLEPGADADLILVDLTRPFAIRSAAFYSKSKISPFEGRAGRGAPVLTMLRGRVVMQDGRIVGAPSGVFLPRSAG